MWLPYWVVWIIQNIIQSVEGDISRLKAPGNKCGIPAMMHVFKLCPIDLKEIPSMQCIDGKTNDKGEPDQISFKGIR